MFDDYESDGMVFLSSAGAGRTPSPQEQPKVRVEFPETWLWSESSAGYHLIAVVNLCLRIQLTQHVLSLKHRLLPFQWRIFD